MVTNGCTGFAQGDDLGVGGRVGGGDISVPSPSHDPAVADDDRSDRDFSGFESALGAAESFFHPEFVCRRLVRARFARGYDGPLF
jgi:hypothetical protein